MIEKKKGGLLYLVMIAYRNIYRNRRRSILCMVASALAVFFIIFMLGFSAGMVDSIVDVVQTFETSHIVVTTKDFDAKKDFYPVQYPVEFQDRSIEEEIQYIKSIEGVNKVFPRISAFATLTNSMAKHAVIWGINIQEEINFQNFNKTKKSSGLQEGRFPEDGGKNECAIGINLAKKMGVKIGDKIYMKIISSQFSDKFYSPKIVGLIDFDYKQMNDNFIVVPFEKLQRITTLQDKTQNIYIYLKNKKETNSIMQILRERYKDSDIIVKDWKSNYFVNMIEQFKFIYAITFSVFVIIASFLIINTIIMIIHERIKEIGMMGALGMQRTEIVKVFFFEALFLSLFGAFIGALVGGIATGIGSIFPMDLNTFTGGGMEMPMANTLFIKFDMSIILFGFFYGLGLSALCTIFPSLKSAFIEPVEALRR
ncbi:MAG: hypothetical protein A2086_07420 [Spirochaetes bacterium GWD1_27_9]|nr:MAG: hypothetical protein A2Z98_09520 [Spirochaetes bacterium GWB1_27_13]OHD26277.1 MAG: hypothetical protein A2Y34_13180 [Spirochaetes bacterium GWC1_27_15]OHD32123.1 MAG: hypothetical protein A2086_07420 [Spirochaetes bacterium GWD1_27_9]